jgi:hypothetical protein
MVNVVSAGAVKLILPEQKTKEGRLNEVKLFAVKFSPDVICNFGRFIEVDPAKVPPQGEPINTNSGKLIDVSAG